MTIFTIKRAVFIGLCLLISSYSTVAKTHLISLKDAPPYTVPTNLEVAVGDTVIWKNDGPELCHVVSDEDARMTSEDIMVGKEWQHTFLKAGVYSYLCLRHFFMRGVITVRNTDGSASSSFEFPYQSAFKEFVVPTVKSVPRMIIPSKVDDSIWFTEGGGDFYGFEGIPPQNKIGKIDESGRITEFATPTKDGDGSKVAVDSLVMDKKGNIWFTERLAGKVGKLSPDGKITEFPLSSPTSGPLGIDIDKSGNLWIAQRYANKISQMTPDGKLTDIELPEPDSEPRTVFVDSRNRVWYTARAANEIGYYDMNTKKLVRLQIPTSTARPAGMWETSDGTIYFVEMVGNKLAKVVGDQIVEFTIPTKFSGAFKIVADAEDNLWFTQVITNSIAKFNTKTHEFIEFKIPTEDSRPGGIAIDRKGRIWFTQQKGNKIAMLDPVKAESLYREQLQKVVPTTEKSSNEKRSDEQTVKGSKILIKEIKVENFSVPTTGAGPGNSLLEDEKGWLWFTELYGNKVGSLHIVSKKFREYPLPTPVSMPTGIARDQNGILWVTQFRGNKLARLDAESGAVEEYEIPTSTALPSGVAVDEMNQVWFTQLGANVISRFNRETKRFEDYSLPRPESGPLHIIADKKGSLWVTASEERGNYLARFDLTAKNFEVFDLPTPNASPIGLLADGQSIWVAEGGAGKLARFHTQEKRWEEYPIPNEKSEPVKLAKDRFGRIWITDGGGLGSAGGNCLLVFDPVQKKFETVGLSNRSAKPMGITMASDGNIWFTQQGANFISQIRQEEEKNESF